MTASDLAQGIINDLLRSAWIIERARGTIYRSWSDDDPSYVAAAENAAARAEIVGRALDGAGRAPDEALVEPHAAWIRSVIGDGPEEIPLAPMFLIRLADWVDAHTAPFLEETERLRQLGDDAKANMVVPSSLPRQPGFDPLPTTDLEPPGEVLFTFGILSDMHIGSRYEKRVRAAIADLNDSPAELVIQLGDITDHGNRSEFDRAEEILSELRMPFATMMGNHDVYSIGEQRLSGREYYGNTFGREPDGVMLEHKGFRFAVLDSIEHFASPFSPFDLITGRFVEGEPSGAVVRGSLTAPQHEILADLAAPGGGPAFVFLHHPVQPFTGFPPVLLGLRDEDSGRLHAVCDSGNVWGIFAGHTHRNARTRDFDGVPAHEVAIPRDFPFGYALVDVCSNGYRYRFLQISDEAMLREGYKDVGELMRRYTRGSDDELAFVWTHDQLGHHD
jgi:hypothetical protein